MCIINNLSSVNERRKNLRGEEKGERERELVRCGFCLGREGENGGGERVIKEGIKREHSTPSFHQKLKPHAFLSSDGVV